MLKFIFLSLLSMTVCADDFNQFLTTIREKALTQGVSKQTLDKAFDGLTPDEKVLEYDRNQAEFKLNFWHYLTLRVSDTRIENGRKALKKHQQLLTRIHQQYGIHPAILVAFWGLETNYGNNVGKMNLIRSLASLSFDLRRRDFFTRELLTLLKLIDQKKLPLEVEGSWAGAMGNMQFMPSNVAMYAIDADQDGVLGLWDSPQDIFTSAAYFLQKIGWHRDERWGREVSLPVNFNYQLANLDNKKTVNEWKNLGVKSADGGDLPHSTLSASLALPMGFNGPVFLLYRNFYAILNWNRSILYALSVGYLADKIIGHQSLFAKPTTEPSLNRDNIIAIQTQLNQLGFDAGQADGISGPKTRAAVRAYQHTKQLPIDGYVGYQLLQQLQLTR